MNLAVCSNKADNFSRAIVEHYYPGVFDLVRGNLNGMPVKPDPTAAREIMRSLDASYLNTLMVGDSNVDIQTGHNAGIKACGVTWGFRSRKSLVEARGGRYCGHACGAWKAPAELIEKVEFAKKRAVLMHSSFLYLLSGVLPVGLPHGIGIGNGALDGFVQQSDKFLGTGCQLGVLGIDPSQADRGFISQGNGDYIRRRKALYQKAAARC